MRRTPRILAIVVFAVLSGLVFTSFVRAYALDGWLRVQVQDEDVDFAIHVPAALARVALTFVPDDIWADARRDIGQWGPAVESAFAELEECDDAVLVSVESDDETVHIQKTGGRFLISVSTPNEQVEVRVPARLVRVVWGQIADNPRVS